MKRRTKLKPQGFTTDSKHRGPLFEKIVGTVGSSQALSDRLLAGSTAFMEVVRDLFRSNNTTFVKELVHLEQNARDPLLRARASLALNYYMLLLFEKILIENKPDQIDSLVLSVITHPEKAVPILASLVSTYGGPIDSSVPIEDPIQARLVKLRALRILLQVVDRVDISEAIEALQRASSMDESAEVRELSEQVIARANRDASSPS